jgi:hypothetical protein
VWLQPAADATGAWVLAAAGVPAFTDAGAPAFADARVPAFTDAGASVFAAAGVPAFADAGASVFAAAGVPAFADAGAPTLADAGACKRDDSVASACTEAVGNALSPAATAVPNCGATQATTSSPMLHSRAMLTSQGYVRRIGIDGSLLQRANLLYAKSECTYEAAPSGL